MKTFQVKIEVPVQAENQEDAEKRAQKNLLVLIGHNELDWSFFEDETETLSKQVQELETKLDALRVAAELDWSFFEDESEVLSKQVQKLERQLKVATEAPQVERRAADALSKQVQELEVATEALQNERAAYYKQVQELEAEALDAWRQVRELERELSALNRILDEQEGVDE